MNATMLKATTWQRTLVTIGLGLSAVLFAVAGPVDSAQAALRTIRVDNTPVTVTQIDTHNWSTLSRSNSDTVALQDGSRGEVWTFDSWPGDCVVITMTSDDFHPYLSLRRDAPFGDEVAHDDGGSDNWAKIHGTLGEGTFYVTATSSGRGEKSGKYSLDVDRC